MSSLARFFIAQSSPSVRSGRAATRLVSGSDLAKSAITQSLAKDGLDVKIGHKKGHINSGLGLVIHSLAAKSDNPEIREAKRLGVPILSYPEAVGRITRAYKTIAVSGAHGKSTTTALASLVLMKAGLDPTVIIGTNLREFPSTSSGRAATNFRAGKSNWLVLEADEFGRSFLRHSPTIAVITNIDLEHLDTYKDLGDIKNAFLTFLSNTKNGGVFVLNKDNKILSSLSAKINKIAKKNNCRTLWYSIHGNTAEKIKRVIKIPGSHNISNAVAAYKVGRALGISHSKILSAIGSYHGSWRRMEYKGLLKPKTSNLKVLVYDDYAHHPTEIKATLRAFKEKYPKSPIVCVYQPHQGKRLQALFKDFVSSFSDADILVLIPMYQVVGRDRVNSHFTSKTLAEAIREKYPKKEVYYLPNPKNIKRFLSKILHSKFYILNSGVVVMMGAGDIANYTKFLLKK